MYGNDLLYLICHKDTAKNPTNESQAWLYLRARISDPLVGGTFITLLNTFWNLGSMWSRSFSLWVVEQITVKSVFSR